MDELFKALLAQGLIVESNEIEANKDKILAVAAQFGVTLDKNIEQLVDGAINSSNFGIFGNAMKGSIVHGLNQAIDKLAGEAPAQESLLFSLIVAAARNYAKKVAG